MKKVLIRIQLLLSITAMLLASVVPPTYAQNSSPTTMSPTTPQLKVATQSDGVSITWNLSSNSTGEISAASINSMVNSLPTMRYGGYDLPMQLRTVLVPDGFDAETKIEQVDSMPWRTAVRLSEPLSPNAIGWEEEYEPAQVDMQLPDKPLFVLREGISKGKRIVVVAFSPIYEVDGEVKVAHNMQAKVPYGKAITGGLSEITSHVQNTAPLRSASSFGPNAPALYAPTNPAASQNAVKITVKDLGIQEISGADLSAMGIGTATPLNNLHIAYEGTKIPVDINDANANGLLDSSDTIRFYAIPKEHSMTAGDYWNDFDVYWLTVETFAGSSGLQMLERSVVPSLSSSASIRTTAMESGIWEDNSQSESTMPGVDNDYWFAGALNSDSSMLGNPTLYPSVSIELNNKLPLANTSLLSTFKLTGSSRTVTTHKMDVAIGGTSQLVSWSNLQYYENWSEVITSTTHSSQMKLTLRPGVNKSSIRYDKIYWEQPVDLKFGSKGATFSGIPGIWRYNMSNVPNGAKLYDVTNPMVPVELIIPSGISVLFQDGPVAKDYLLASTGTLFTPSLEMHTPVIFNANEVADTIYVAPANFHDELQPLVAHRQSQGYAVKVVDVEDIYDAWSFGAASPKAVRKLLQFAKNNWENTQWVNDPTIVGPAAAVLVGDTTSDPRNYYGNMKGEQNKNIVPTYLEHIDPWIGRTACEVCMAQLDGDEPFDDDSSTLIDIWLGRLSAQTETHVKDIVSKILTYETAGDLNITNKWRGKSVYISEEYVSSKCVVDSAGDFSLFADEIIRHWQSPTVDTQRIYYDPRPLTNPATCDYYTPTVDSWREPNAIAVRDKTIAAFQNGAGLITTNTHSNHYQWGSTDKTNNPTAWLLGYGDILSLQNKERLPFLFELTCYTSQFTLATASESTGTVMDERFQRHADGGAVGIFGPAGLTVAYGHDWLAAGAHEYLWESEPYQGLSGEMVENAYLKLFTDGSCCQDARMSFLYLGDPLMPMLINDYPELYLPVITKEQAAIQ